MGVERREKVGLSAMMVGESRIVGGRGKVRGGEMKGEGYEERETIEERIWGEIAKEVKQDRMRQDQGR